MLPWRDGRRRIAHKPAAEQTNELAGILVGIVRGGERLANLPPQLEQRADPLG